PKIGRRVLYAHRRKSKRRVVHGAFAFAFDERERVQNASATICSNNFAHKGEHLKIERPACQPASYSQQDGPAPYRRGKSAAKGRPPPPLATRALRPRGSAPSRLTARRRCAACGRPPRLSRAPRPQAATARRDTPRA